MSSIEQDIAQVRNAVYGREVREAIADGLEKLASGNSGPQNIKDGIGTKAVIEGEVDGNTPNIASGSHSHAEGLNTQATKERAHAEGRGCKATGANSHAEGNGCTASGQDSHAEGQQTTASYAGAHAEGMSTTASGWSAPHAEGAYTVASGQTSHAEGNQTTAEGKYSHSEGYKTTASGESSHAEGQQTTASGNCSHAEGKNTVAYGACAHAEGEGTYAHYYNHVFGHYNVKDMDSTYLEIVGNGYSDSGRSNARTLDFGGNERLAGDLTLGMGTNDEVTITAAKLKQLLALLN